jgi:Arc/MetJ-type ribon-helix-helix transcriptional regulator
MARIRLVVSDEQKQRWSEAVEDDPEFDTVSDLIRKSVEKRLKQDSQVEEETDLDPVLDELDSMERQLYDLQNAVKVLQTDTPTRTEMEEILEWYSDAIVSDVPVEVINRLEDERGFV